MRLQLALNVPDLAAAVSYYSKLFGTEAHKIREGYANFAIDEPPLKLVLFENAETQDRLNHLGVEVVEPEEIGKALQRLTDAGLVEEVQRDETCCHATQDKIWSRAPDGSRWEWYRITDDQPAPAKARSHGETCCVGKTKRENLAGA